MKNGSYWIEIIKRQGNPERNPYMICISSDNMPLRAQYIGPLSNLTAALYMAYWIQELISTIECENIMDYIWDSHEEFFSKINRIIEDPLIKQYYRES